MECLILHISPNRKTSHSPGIDPEHNHPISMGSQECQCAVCPQVPLCHTNEILVCPQILSDRVCRTSCTV